jgi:hypothetical protein
LITEGLALGSIGGSNLGTAWNSTIESFTTQIAFHVFWVVVSLRPVVVIVGIKIKTHFAKILHDN